MAGNETAIESISMNFLPSLLALFDLWNRYKPIRLGGSMHALHQSYLNLPSVLAELQSMISLKPNN